MSSGYPKPKIHPSFNPADFYDKNSSVVSSSSGGNDMALPAYTDGVVFYNASNKKLYTAPDFIFKNIGTKFLGIGTNNPLTNLSITPADGYSSKFTLYDNGDAVNCSGIGVSNDGQMNYCTINNTKDHVFWAGGKNDNGTETVRIQSSNAKLFSNFQEIKTNARNLDFGATTPSPATEYPLLIQNNTSSTGNHCAIGFMSDASLSQSPGAAITYQRGTTDTNGIGTLSIRMKQTNNSVLRVMDFLRNRIVGYSVFGLINNNFSDLVTTGTLSTCSSAVLYPLYIYSTTSSVGNTRAAISFSSDTVADPITGGQKAAADICYVRTQATFDGGELRINLTDTATTRTNIATFGGSLITMNRRVNIFTGSIGEKIRIYQNVATGYPMGFGVTAYRMNYHIDQADCAHVFYAAGVNADSNSVELMRIQGNKQICIGTTQGASAAGAIIALPSKFCIDTKTFESKICLYENNSTTDISGFGVSSNLGFTQLNYHVNNPTGSHVFYHSGKNGDGTEIMRVNDTGLTTQRKITITPAANGAKVVLYDDSGYYAGIGVTSDAVNYHVDYVSHHVFYTGGTNADGQELVRFNNVGGVLMTLPDSFPNYVGTGANLAIAALAAKSYPLCIYSLNGTVGQRRAGIAFCDNTNADDVPPWSISYTRRNATFDQGELAFDFTDTYTSATAITRTNMMTLSNTLAYFNKRITLRESTAGASITLPTVNQSRINLNTATFESKICLYDNNTSGTMAGIGVSSNMFNFQIPSTSYGYYFRYGGTNGDGNTILPFQIRFVTINSVANTSAIGVGINNAAPAYQIQLAVDSAGKPGTNTWTIVSDERIKDDIEKANIDMCYENIKKLTLKRFRWKDDVYTEGQVPDRRVLGWIAQDVKEVFPKSVRIYNNESLGISDCHDLNVDEIYKAHYGATQKLIQKVEALENENTQLKTLLETVMNRLNTLENQFNNLKN